MTFKEYKCPIHGYGWIPDDDSISIVVNPNSSILRCPQCTITVKDFQKDYPVHSKKININVLSDAEKQHAKCGKYAHDEWIKTLNYWKNPIVKPEDK